MPYDLFVDVVGEIPDHIGVYCGKTNVKRAKKQPLGVDEKILMSSLIRSLSREFDYNYKSQDECKMRQYKRQISRLESDVNSYRRRFNELYNGLTREERKRILGEDDN